MYENRLNRIWKVSSLSGAYVINQRQTNRYLFEEDGSCRLDDSLSDGLRYVWNIVSRHGRVSIQNVGSREFIHERDDGSGQVVLGASKNAAGHFTLKDAGEGAYFYLESMDNRSLVAEENGEVRLKAQESGSDEWELARVGPVQFMTMPMVSGEAGPQALRNSNRITPANPVIVTMDHRRRTTVKTAVSRPSSIVMMLGYLAVLFNSHSLTASRSCLVLMAMCIDPIMKEMVLIVPIFGGLKTTGDGLRLLTRRLFIQRMRYFSSNMRVPGHRFSVGKMSTLCLRN